VEFDSFSFVDTATGICPPLPAQTLDWKDNIPRTAISADGVALVHYFPRFLKQKGIVSPDLTDILCLPDSPDQNKLTQKLLTYAQAVPPHRSKYGLDQFVGRKGEICGEINIVRAWHAIGHPVGVFFFMDLHCSDNL
jgi:hypothetical protein